MFLFLYIAKREAPPPYESLYPVLAAHAQPQQQQQPQQFYQATQPQPVFYTHQPQQYYQQPQQYQYEYQPQQQFYVTQQYQPQPGTVSFVLSLFDNFLF